MDNAFKETKQIECKIKENCKIIFMSVLKLDPSELVALSMGWHLHGNGFTSTNFLRVFIFWPSTTFSLKGKKTKKLNYHFAQLPFLPRRRFPQIILLVSGSKYFLKVDGHFRTQIVRSRSFKNCNSLKHFSQTPSSVHCSQPLPHSKGWKKRTCLNGCAYLKKLTVSWVYAEVLAFLRSAVEYQ